MMKTRSKRDKKYKKKELYVKKEKSKRCGEHPSHTFERQFDARLDRISSDCGTKKNPEIRVE